MPVVTAAIAAVAAAAAATTVATVATAVVAVSTAIGVAGLAVTAVGMITKNEDLLKAGKIMGYVGLAGGLAGGAIGGFGAMATGTGSFLEGASAAYSGAAGHMSEAWDKGVGSWFSSDTAGAVAGPVPGGQPSTFTQAPGAQPGIGAAPSTSMPGAENATLPGQALDKSYVMKPESLGDDLLSSAAPQSAVVNPAEQAYAGQVASANTAPSAPVGATGAQGYTVPSVNAGVDDAIANAGSTMRPGAGVLQPGAGLMNSASTVAGAADKAKGMWDSLPDWMKMSMMTTGAQGISGLASGYFAGASAEDRLAFEKYVNAQRQAQIDLQNRNASYVPMLRFAGPTGPAGLLDTVGRRA